MKKYIYWNDKNWKFFEAKEGEERDFVVNHFDVSDNPCFTEVLNKTENRFEVKAELYALRLGKHFESTWVGDGKFCFKINQ